jgi:hypothetical protein
MAMDTEPQSPGQAQAGQAPGAGAPPNTMAPRDGQQATQKPHEQAPVQAPESGGEGDLGGETEARKRKSADAQTADAMNDKAKNDRYAGARERQAMAPRGQNYDKTKQATQPQKPRTEPVPKKFERTFGYDFSQVAIHYGTGLPEKQGDLAFTQGKDIFYGDNAPAVETAKGTELLGHELTHVIQQNADLPKAPGAEAATGPDGKPKKADDADKTAGKDEQGASAAQQGKDAPKDAGQDKDASPDKNGGAGEKQADAAGKDAAGGKQTDVAAGTATEGAVQHKKDDATAGTKEASQQNQALMDATVDDRVAALKQAIAAKDWDATTKQLAGGGADLEAKYLAAHGVGLKASLQKAFPTIWQQDYLNDLIVTGKPSRKSKIALSCGLVSTPACNEDEVIKLCEEADVGEWQPIWMSFSRWFLFALSPSGYERLETFNWLMKATGAKPAAKDQQKAAEIQKLWKVGHLGSIVKHRCAGLGVDSEKLLEDVKAWVAAASLEERAAAYAEGSELRSALEQASGVIWGLGRNDKQQILDLVKPPEQLPADQQQTAPVDPNDPEAVKKAEELKKKQLADADAVSGLERTLAREQGKWNSDEEAVKKAITDMTDEQREIYLVKHLAPAEQQEWKDPAIDRKRKQALFDKAMAAIAVELDKAGLDKKEVAAMTARFQFGAAAGGAYIQLKEMMADQPWFGVGKKVLELVTQLKGAEFAQVRQDQALVDKIKASVGVGTKEWQQISALLGVTDAVDDKALMAEGADKKAEDDATLRPKYWATLIDIEIQKAWFFPDKDKILGQMHGAQKAALKSQTLLDKQKQAPTDASAAPKPTTGPKPLTASDFLFQVYMELPANSIVWLQDSLPPVYDAITKGWKDPATWITVDTRLNEAKGFLGGLGSTDSAIVASFEELDGQELLEEWSNINEFRALGTQVGELEEQYKALQGAQPKDEGKLKELEAKIGVVRGKQGKFILSIREDRRAYLQSQMSNGEVVDTIKKLTDKLTGAAEKDPEFQKALEEAKLPNDAYMRERMKSLASLDEQRLKDSGIQFDLFSAKSQERKESANELVADHRMTEQKIDATGGDQKKIEEVKNEGAEQIAKDREELERRTQAFDEMRDKAKEIAGAVIAILAAVIVTVATGGAGAASLPILYQLLIAGGTAVVKEAANWAIEGDAYKKSDMAKEVILACLQVGIDKFGEAVSGALGASKYGPDALKEAMSGHPYLGEALASQYDEQVKKIVTGVPEDLARSFLTDEKPFANMGSTLQASLKSKLAEAPQEILTGALKNMAKKGMFEGIDKAAGTELAADEQTTVGGAVTKTVLDKEADAALDFGGQTFSDLVTGKSTDKVDATSVALGQLEVAQAGLESAMEVKHKEEVLKKGDPKEIAEEMKIASDNPDAVAERLKGLSLADASKKLESHYLATLTGAYGYDKECVKQFGIEDKSTFDDFVANGPKGWATASDAKKAVKGWLDAKKTQKPATTPAPHTQTQPAPTNTTVAPNTAAGAIAP